MINLMAPLSEDELDELDHFLLNEVDSDEVMTLDVMDGFPHASATDPDARLFRTGNHQAAILAYQGHVLMETRSRQTRDWMLLGTDRRLAKAGRADAHVFSEEP
jgi:hypothetical protein